MKFDRKKVFDGIKDRIDATLNQSQVDGINAILDGLSVDDLWVKDKDVRKAAYAFATIFHETAGTFQPIHEYGSTAYFNKRYGPNTKVGKRLGNTKAGDGARYAGRGYVQLTGRANYRKFGLENSPDDAMRPDLAFHILSTGMLTGLFTGKKFSDYISATECDYVEARRIINGTDKAGLIAGYAKSFEKILRSSLAAGQTGNVSVAKNGQEPSETPLDSNSTAAIVSEGTIETTAIDGQTVVEKTIETPGTVTVETQSDYKGVGLINVLKKDFAAVGGGNISFQSLQAYAEQASGWPTWVISLITKIATIAVILGAAWLLFRAVHYLVWKVGGYFREHTEAKINADPKMKDVAFKV